jgi:lipopolysaccharide export system permease protein
MMSTFGLVFLPILVVYYPLMQFGVDQAKTGALPPYCVWSGNLILSIVGLLLLRPVLRQ